MQLDPVIQKIIKSVEEGKIRRSHDEAFIRRLEKIALKNLDVSADIYSAIEFWLNRPKNKG